MFGLQDIVKFFWSFLIVFPAVSVLHVLGHSVMAVLFGGKSSLEIGMGKIAENRPCANQKCLLHGFLLQIRRSEIR